MQQCSTHTQTKTHIHITYKWILFHTVHNLCDTKKHGGCVTYWLPLCNSFSLTACSCIRNQITPILVRTRSNFCVPTTRTTFHWSSPEQARPVRSCTYEDWSLIGACEPSISIWILLLWAVHDISSLYVRVFQRLLCIFIPCIILVTHPSTLTRWSTVCLCV